MNGTKMISTNNIAILLGKNSSPLHVISSAIFVVVLFFYIFTVSSYFHVYVSPLENRVNYHELFATHIINEFVDHIILVSGMVLWLGLSLKGKSLVKVFSPSSEGIVSVCLMKFLWSATKSIIGSAEAESRWV